MWGEKSRVSNKRPSFIHPSNYCMIWDDYIITYIGLIDVDSGRRYQSSDDIGMSIPSGHVERGVFVHLKRRTTTTTTTTTMSRIECMVDERWIGDSTEGKGKRKERRT